ncbi:ribosome biogenesis GTPase Der [Congregibacter litoralis]|uniref:GTPase Der n=1 Tax=Congregibacter litoralis KT71 TaxID=314285 RepID=A4A462_9GAMM|nr:ribosome biogenesis GTPase Der [Congregibacter litoralis]EAQ99485.1 ribosome-associated GTPase EngA [Congregibacter litoralis KT71]
MLPSIALVGRPNVGKSTLFNQLTRSRDALVANLSGLTRDRKYGEGRSDDRAFIVIDTGGVSGDEEGIDAAMAEQSLLAIEEADIVLLLVDARDGLNPVDEQLVQYLRQQSRDFHLVVNKIDGRDPDVAVSDFHALGIASMHAIAASHGRGVRQMIESVLETIPRSYEHPEAEGDSEEEGGIEGSGAEQGEDEAEDHGGTRVAIVGRPNVGKSTLVNRILGEERVVVYDQPGTTRDSVYIKFVREGRPYTLIDTAGVRRRKNVREAIEKFSIIKTLSAISDANVVVLLVDGQEGLVDQDLHLLGHCLEAGRALVLAVNKWDGLDPDQKEMIRSELDRRLRFVEFADMHFISALHGSGVGTLFGSIDAAYAAAMQPMGTSRLTRILEEAVADHPPPLVNGRRIKLRYAHAGGRNPPRVVVHGNQTDKVPNSYQRYLEKVFSRRLELTGTPLRIEFRSSDNPFAGQRNKLTNRQINRKRRLMAHVKQAKKSKQQKKRR